MSRGNSYRPHWKPKDRHRSLVIATHREIILSSQKACTWLENQPELWTWPWHWLCDMVQTRLLSLSELQLVICTRVHLAVLTPPL